MLGLSRSLENQGSLANICNFQEVTIPKRHRNLPGLDETYDFVGATLASAHIPAPPIFPPVNQYINTRPLYPLNRYLHSQPELFIYLWTSLSLTHPRLLRTLLFCLRRTLQPSATGTSSFRNDTSTSGSAVSSAAYMILCVRFTCFVRLISQAPPQAQPSIRVGG